MPQISATTPPPVPPAPRVIRLRADAPAKPAEGAACNGCGVCCAWAPCPAGIVVSRRRHGRCRALVWQDGQYRCGLLVAPGRFVGGIAGGLLRGLPQAWMRGLAARWIAAGRGCDASLRVD